MNFALELRSGGVNFSKSMTSQKTILTLAVAGMMLEARLPAQENPGTPWPAMDALGRALPLASEVGSPKTNRFVGIFYFINH